MKLEKSIMGFPMDKCIICRSPYIHIHHILFGNANRALATKYGLFLPLCYEHHEGNNGVHHNKELDDKLKHLAKIKFEENYDIPFEKIFGKCY